MYSYCTKLSLLLLCLLSVALCFDAGDYDNTQVLEENYEIFWKVEGDVLNLALKVNTTGWVGFGIAEQTSGSMPGSDMVIGHVNDAGVASSADYHSLDFVTPTMDDCQTWTLVAGEEIDGWTYLEVSRPLESDDAQDRTIIPGVNKVVYAYGKDGQDVLQYHEGRRRATAVHFYGSAATQIEDIKSNANYKFFELLADGYNITHSPTEYINFVMLLNDTNVNPDFGEDYHIVAIEPIVHGPTSKYIHHFAVLSIDQSGILNQVWGWAQGVGALILPAEAGFRAGQSSNAIYHLRLNIHYDNVWNDTVTEPDYSGIRIYYATGTNMRTYDAGVLRLGDPYVRNSWDPIVNGTGRKTYEYDCPSACTEVMITEPVTAFGSFLHMHEVGRLMWSNLWRNGTKVAELNRVEFFQFAFQQQTDVNYQILPGDRISIGCQYERQPDRNIIFGQASQEEMCIHSLSYYPRVGTQNLCGVIAEGVTMCDVTSNYILGQPSEYDNDGSDDTRFGANLPAFECPVSTEQTNTGTEQTNTGSQQTNTGSQQTNTGSQQTTSDNTQSTTSSQTEDGSLEDSASIQYLSILLSLAFFLF